MCLAVKDTTSVQYRLYMTKKFSNQSGYPENTWKAEASVSSQVPVVIQLCSRRIHRSGSLMIWYFMVIQYFEHILPLVSSVKARSWLTQGVGGGIFGSFPPPSPRFAQGLSAADGRLFVFGGSDESGAKH